MCVCVYIYKCLKVYQLNNIRKTKRDYKRKRKKQS